MSKIEEVQRRPRVIAAIMVSATIQLLTRDTRNPNRTRLQGASFEPAFPAAHLKNKLGEIIGKEKSMPETTHSPDIARVAEKTRSARIDVTKVAPEAYQAMAELQKYVRQSGLEPSLLELVRMRASQINGCAYCIDMHSKDARAAGETEQRLYELDAWRETPFYTERERAALAWTEAVTLVSQSHVPDEVYELARKQFSEKEIVDLTLAVAAINTWNRISISLRAVPGTYQPASHAKTAGAPRAG
jgi:AhpD family alkylhydroperoxidase